MATYFDLLSFDLHEQILAYAVPEDIGNVWRSGCIGEEAFQAIMLSRHQRQLLDLGWVVKPPARTPRDYFYVCITLEYITMQTSTLQDPKTQVSMTEEGGQMVREAKDARERAVKIFNDYRTLLRKFYTAAASLESQLYLLELLDRNLTPRDFCYHLIEFYLTARLLCPDGVASEIMKALADCRGLRTPFPSDCPAHREGGRRTSIGDFSAMASSWL